MILITGASGKTGKAILLELKRCGQSARALVHQPDQVQEALESGAQEAVAGDLLNPYDLLRAMQEVESVYHICPNMAEKEIEIGQRMLESARSAGVRHFVYHSVLHPQAEAMPHHWKKLRVEELIFTSGLDYTILQPCAYMQNVAGYWKAIVQDGVYAIPYAPGTRTSVVDLEDVAAAAVKVLTCSGHTGAIYELAGPEPLSQVEMASIIGSRLERKVEARALDRGEWERQARAGGLPEYAVTTLLSMFEYYERHGFTGSPQVLAWLLGRTPRRFADFIQAML